MPASKEVFATKRTVEENGVDGKTFHEYSIPTSKAILRNVRSERLTSNKNLLDKNRVSCSPGQEGKLLRIPGIKLVMERACKYNAY